MKFTVVWSPDAEQDLAAVWISAHDRTAVTLAANTLDRLLAENPESLGESRDRNVRVAFARPLGVGFEVYPDERVAFVVAVWSF